MIPGAVQGGIGVCSGRKKVDARFTQGNHCRLFGGGDWNCAPHQGGNAQMNEPGTVDFHDLPIGAEIFTSDGERIGEVKERRHGWFKVNAAMQPDYWLPRHTVVSMMDDGVVRLSFPNERLGEYKSTEPLAA
jgi:hypothetical protein